MAHSGVENARGKRTRASGRVPASRKSSPVAELEIEESVEGIGFWTKSGVSAQFFVRPCRKRFDLYQLSATPPSPLWHHESVQPAEIAELVSREDRKGR